MFKLIAQNGVEYPLAAPVTTIGREGCDILLLQDDQVSRRHAQLEQRGDTLLLTDLGSTNGVFVNRVRLQEPRPLQPGDVVRVGNTALTVMAEENTGATRLMSEPPQWQAAPVPGDVYIPPPVSHAPVAYGQPTKDKSIVYVLEILLLGLGWIYAGETGTGIAILVAWAVVGLLIGIPVDIVTDGLGCLCTGPLAILAYTLSLTQLNKYVKEHPDVFH